jgi:hypothetical protein
VTDRHVGFTGSRDKDMPERQAQAVLEFMAGFVCLHHGDCLGRDAHAHRLARQIGMLVEIHPPIYRTMRAFCAADYTNTPRRFLTRDRNIVDATEALIAAPKGFEEQLRSGTWATVRYAKQLGKRVIVVFPDGTTEMHP